MPSQQKACGEGGGRKDIVNDCTKYNDDEAAAAPDAAASSIPEPELPIGSADGTAVSGRPPANGESVESTLEGPIGRPAGEGDRCSSNAPPTAEKNWSRKNDDDVYEKKTRRANPSGEQKVEVVPPEEPFRADSSRVVCKGSHGDAGADGVGAAAEARPEVVPNEEPPRRRPANTGTAGAGAAATARPEAVPIEEPPRSVEVAGSLNATSGSHVVTSPCACAPDRHIDVAPRTGGGSESQRRTADDEAGAVFVRGPSLTGAVNVGATEDAELGRAAAAEEEEPAPTMVAGFLAEDRHHHHHRPGGTHDEHELERRVRERVLHDAPLIEGEAVVPSVGGVADDARAPSIEDGRTKWSNLCLPRRKRLMAVAALALMITVIVATLVSHVVPEQPATPPAPVTICTSDRCEAIRSVLEPLVTNQTSLEDASTPQARAVIWLADEDVRRVNVSDTFNLTQRFAVATIYFATGGGDGTWRESANFLTAGHECEWHAWATEEIHHFDKLEKGVQCYGTNVVIEMHLTSHNLSGTLPGEIGLLSQMRYLNMNDNVLAGTIPPFLSTFRNLGYLGMGWNRFTGTIPSFIGKMTELVVLDLGLNTLTGPIPETFVNLDKLKYLFLNYNYLNSTIPSFSNHPNLTFFAMQGNYLSGALPASLNNLTSLSVLYTSDNLISGTIPLEAGLPLTELLLQLNLMNGTIPTALSSFSNLSYLHLSYNSFSGTLPPQLWDLSELESLDLSANLRLSGTLSPEIGKLRHLEQLGLVINSLNGTIPASIVELTNLTSLGLGQNDFSGTIPDDIGKLDRLDVLNLWDNYLNGTVPPSIGNMKDVRIMYLTWNHLTGTLPATFAQLTSLYMLSLDGNDLTGDIDFLCDVGIELLEADCHGPDPLVNCSCCPRCCDRERICSPPRGPSGF